MILDPKLQNLFEDYLSASYNKSFIEPFFDDKRIIDKSPNIIFNKGKSFLCKKEDVWKPDKIHNKKGIHVSNCYFQIRKLNNCYLLINRYQSDFRLIHGPRTTSEKTSTIIWTSDDGLSFDSENRFIISDEDVDNHNTFFVCQQCEEGNKIMLFKGRGYGKKTTDSDRNFEFYKDTGLKLQFFQNEFKNFSSQTLVVEPSHMPKNKFWCGDLFDSLNSISYHNKKYFVHARVNRIDFLETAEAHSRNNRRKKNTDYFYRNRAVKLLIYDENLHHTEIYSNHKETYCKYYDSYPYKNCKYVPNELNYVDVYIGNVFDYPNTTYNLATPTGLIYERRGNPKDRNFSNYGLFFTSKKEQLNFFRVKKNKENLPELKPEQYYFINGMVENKEKTHYNFYAVKEKKQIDCFEIQKDRFMCITSGNETGYVVMKAKTYFKTLNVNFETFEDGFIYCQLLDKESNVVAQSVKMKGDFINYHVEFISKDEGMTLGFLYEYRLKIILNKACLFSYKLT